MSFYGFATPGQPVNTAAMELDQSKIQTAEHEVELMMGLYENIVRNCKAKCFVHYYAESELTKGENCCVDRCTAKFMRSNQIISEYLQKINANPETFSNTASILPTLGQHKLPDP